MLIARARILLLALFTSLVAACGGGGSPGVVPRPPAPPPALGLTEVAGATSPVFLTAPAGDPRLFIVERAGRIRIVQNGVLLPTPFLDIGPRVVVTAEGGLLSLAFAPLFALNRHFYYYYTDINNNIVVARGTASPLNPNLAEPLSELPLLAIPHPFYTNHYGGQLAFGPDGYLYLATGDGGGSGDPLRNAQNLNSLLGKMLRIDVAGATLARPYHIPPTNPFVSQFGRRPEIWALGLRNPWRFAFDGGLLYTADVGQARREEINIAGVSTAGLNYGWNIMEGGQCFDAANCVVAGLTLPALEYLHSPTSPNCAVTGGYVYRGRAIPELAGHYFYSDYCAGFLKSFRFAGRGIEQQTDWPIGAVGNIVSFGTDGDGELYLVSASGKIYKIVRL
ncbi:PQQ-dependent sugar dehydrogenase [Massilia glaciei]|uniref:Glucose dehydrogenase n=1 Tax=Massilia glaciei TaxID=1524097 RepID=A0A2U2HIU1_9BURK|nr:PQQ-dependent sugar dehydrogenase [Massilia glaciei]PWF46680.1 glucose dehydrogenase [Massilia glaciei]